MHRLAELAVEKLSWGLDRLRLKLETNQAVHPSDHVVAPVPDQDTVDRVTACFHDTVMGNTGMVLLEDSGLQSHTSERFSPLTWVVAEAGSEASIRSHLKQEQHQQQACGQSVISNGMMLHGSGKSALTLQELQGTAGSPQNPVSERNRASPPTQVGQPHHCATKLSPPISFAESMTRPQHSRQDPSPHLHGYHSRRVTPPTAVAYKDTPQVRNRSSKFRTPEQWAHSNSTNKQHQMSAAQLRHNSCPSLHPFATTPPLLRSTYSSPLSNGLHSPVSNERCDMHTEWAANPATPALPSLEAEVTISPMSDQGQVDMAVSHERIQQQHVAHHYSFQHSTAVTGSDEPAVLAGQHMTVDEWKRWVGNRVSG